MGKREVEIFWENRGNPLKNWHKVVSVPRLIKNTTIMMMCKNIPSMAIKRKLYRKMGMIVGKNVVMTRGVTIDVFFPELIEIGDNTMIGYESFILTHEFLLDKAKKGKVKIGKNVTIGGWTLIMPGVTIGEGSIVAAGSLVKDDVPANTLVAGVPARAVKELP